ncbi:hypothetical protein GCM10022254_45520 [Actinomadura meridiana]|uniref:non-specific serine/threonine protein kinase n=1 Tax=Actinomadura meridiana TaxID=559626 RepID=A0ABP8C9V3_9ACTN
MAARLLAGRYRLESVVGRGGMGTVWRARDEILDRDVAVKEVVLPAGLDDDERGNRHLRTLREARALARLNHPGAVTVHDVVDEDDRPWIVMELVEARSLQEIVDEDGPLPPGRAAVIGRQVAGALRAAHTIGILHRDVKPANVLVTGDDRGILTDFGIAQLSGDVTLTSAGMVMGSPAYMSPERINGDPAVAASDLWALGATLYTATEGKSPHHQTDPMALLAAVLTRDVPPPRNAGPLAPVLAGLLERDPARRMTVERAEESLAAVASGHAASLAAAHLAPHATPHPHAAPHPHSNPHPHSTMAVEASPAPVTGPEPGPTPGPVPDGVTTWFPQGPGGSYPPGPGGPWTSGTAQPVAPSRRVPVLPVLAGAVVAVAALAVAGYLLWPDGSSGPERGGSNPPATIAGTSAPKPSDTPSTSQSPSTPVSSPAAPTQLPDGLVPGRGSGFTIGVPAGWRRSVQGNSVIWINSATNAYVQVDRTPWSGDPYWHWVAWERQAIADGKLKNFQRVAPITRTSVAGTPAADIEFTWSRAGVTRARDRGLVVDGRSYAVVVALPASQWNENEALVKNVLDTFRPSGVG